MEAERVALRDSVARERGELLRQTKEDKETYRRELEAELHRAVADCGSKVAEASSCAAAAAKREREAAETNELLRAELIGLKRVFEDQGVQVQEASGAAIVEANQAIARLQGEVSRSAREVERLRESEAEFVNTAAAAERERDAALQRAGELERLLQDLQELRPTGAGLESSANANANEGSRRSGSRRRSGEGEGELPYASSALVTKLTADVEELQIKLRCAEERLRSSDFRREKSEREAGERGLALERLHHLEDTTKLGRQYASADRSEDSVASGPQSSSSNQLLGGNMTTTTTTTMAAAPHYAASSTSAGTPTTGIGHTAPYNHHNNNPHPTTASAQGVSIGGDPSSSSSPAALLSSSSNSASAFVTIKNLQRRLEDKERRIEALVVERNALSYDIHTRDRHAGSGSSSSADRAGSSGLLLSDVEKGLPKKAAAAQPYPATGQLINIVDAVMRSACQHLYVHPRLRLATAAYFSLLHFSAFILIALLRRAWRISSP
eukprot:GHVU01212671.1.p1 GENE.GHVU01212671.1~~GHVU01212671.1.p1  ORF type:complete len:550 (-),score=153.49 GHVU01212671.1:173-1666(-)